MHDRTFSETYRFTRRFVALVHKLPALLKGKLPFTTSTAIIVALVDALQTTTIATTSIVI